MDSNVLQLIIRLRDEASNQLDKFSGKLDKVGSNLQDVGGKMVAFGAAPTAALVMAGKAAVDFESSFAGIRKTVDASESDFTKLSDNIRQIAKISPISANEMNKIGEMAGQLGVRGVDNLTKFIDTVAKVGVTTNLSGEEAATSFARIANIMQEPIINVDRMASVVVDLGNNFATTEAEIVGFANRIAGAGKIAGLATNEIFSIGAAMSSVGVEAESGGTAVQKVLIAMNTAVTQGNGDLAVFAKTAGLTIEQFKDLSAVERFQNFVMGLGDAGDGAITVLEELGMQDQRLIRAFLSLANAGDLVINATKRGTTAWKENNAATIEAEKRFKTTESQLAIMRNNLYDLGITLGTVILPALNKFLTALTPLINKFAEFAEKHPNLIVGVLALGAGIGALGVVLFGLGIVIQGVSAALSVMGVFLAVISSPIFLIIAAIVAVIAIIWVFRNQIFSIFQAVYDFILNIFTSLYNAVIVPIWTAIQNYIVPVLQAIWTVVSYILNAIQVLFQFVFMAIQFVVQLVMAYLQATIIGILLQIWGVMGPQLTQWATSFVTTFNNIKNTVTKVFNDVKTWFINQLNSLTTSITSITERITGLFRTMASGIMSALKSIKFPHLSIGEGSVNVAGKEIKYPKMNVDWYEKGGWVKNTGLAVVHEGEYVLSKGMLQGSQRSEVSNFNQPITVNNIINSQVDMDSIGYQLAWSLRNSR